MVKDLNELNGRPIADPTQHTSIKMEHSSSQNIEEDVSEYILYPKLYRR